MQVNPFVSHFPDTQIFSTKYPVTCKVYTEYHATSTIEHGLSACTVNNPLAKARGLSLRIGGQPCSTLHIYTKAVCNGTPFTVEKITLRVRIELGPVDQ